ncbi:MAG: biotin/lipoate A/B protein ligase family protein [Candidatus Nanohaloarchaea archaeon]|nr:biotin/lipoate A/B protein ligase family protein [Candidatus Nanohaloarchaea archaeon]
MSEEFRIVDSGPFSEAMHHALDEVMTEKMKKREIKPTLRFWYRENPAVPLGRFQSFEDEVQTEYVKEKDIEVVRRLTGGGAMYVEPENVITYSLYLPKKKVPEDIEESYRELDSWVLEALNELGLEVEHQPLNDIVHPEGKIGGAAQLRRRRSVLHHATLSYSLDIPEMLKVLRIGKEKLSDKAIKSAEKRVAVMKDHIDHTREEVIEALKDKFREKYGGTEKPLSTEEMVSAGRLVDKKFSRRKWNRKM